MSNIYDWFASGYNYFKAIHITFVVSWFAGLFYLVRLFIYHTEAQELSVPERKVLQDQYKIMERRLWNFITRPAMILTLLSGLAMLMARTYLLYMDWMYVKFGLLVLLLLYHWSCGYILRNLRKDRMVGSSISLRMWNEVATLLLVAIVFVVVLKDTSLWLWGVAGLVGLGILFMIVIRLVNPRKK